MPFTADRIGGSLLLQPNVLQAETGEDGRELGTDLLGQIEGFFIYFSVLSAICD